MKESWQKLKSTYQQQFDAVLNPGAEVSQIEKLETRIGKKLPSDFVELYTINNGQTNESYGIFDWGNKLLSIEMIETIWMDSHADERRVMEKTDFGDERVKGFIDHPFWIPIMEDANGDAIYMDLDPEPQGKYGQLIEVLHNDAERPVCADSLCDLMQEYLEASQAGDLIYSEENQCLMFKEDCLYSIDH